MDNISLIILVRAVLAFVFALGGIYALRQGFKVVNHERGQDADGSTVSFGTFRASLQTVGSVVMLTSVVWAGFGYLSAPRSLSTSPEGQNTFALLPDREGDSRRLCSGIPALVLEEPELVEFEGGEFSLDASSTEQLDKAVDWIRAKSTEYGCDTLYVVGHSDATPPASNTHLAMRRATYVAEFIKAAAGSAGSLGSVSALRTYASAPLVGRPARRLVELQLSNDHAPSSHGLEPAL